MTVSLTPVLIGWGLGLLSSVVLEWVRSDRKARGLSRLLRAELDLTFEAVVRVHQTSLDRKEAILQTRVRLDLPERIIYRSSLSQLTELPFDCLSDLVRLNMLINNCERFSAQLDTDDPAVNRLTYYHMAIGALEGSIKVCRKLIQRLSELDGYRIADEELDSLESKYRQGLPAWINRNIAN